MTLGLNPVQTLARIAQTGDEHQRLGEPARARPDLRFYLELVNSMKHLLAIIYTLNGSYFYACVEYVCMKNIFVNNYVYYCILH